MEADYTVAGKELAFGLSLQPEGGKQPNQSEVQCTVQGTVVNQHSQKQKQHTHVRTHTQTTVD